MRELEGFGIRINKKQPDISFKKKEKGGLGIISTVKLTHLNNEIITSILKEYKIANADIFFRCDATEDQLIDIIEGNRVYIPAIFILNKIDQITIEELDLLDRIPHSIPICAAHEWNMDSLLKMIWSYLDLIRIYTKPKGQLADFSEPVILKRTGGTSVENFCRRIHRNMVTQFKYAWVWGNSVKHNPQKVGLKHVLADEDVVQIVKKIS